MGDYFLLLKPVIKCASFFVVQLSHAFVVKTFSGMLCNMIHGVFFFLLPFETAPLLFRRLSEQTILM